MGVANLIVGDSHVVNGGANALIGSTHNLNGNYASILGGFNNIIDGEGYAIYGSTIAGGIYITISEGYSGGSGDYYATTNFYWWWK